MKRSEILKKYYGKIVETLPDYYRSVVENDGNIQYSVYIWSDGEIEALSGPAGDTAYLRARDKEARELFFVDTISEPGNFSVWDHAENGEPDDETERETMRGEIIDWLVDQYQDIVRDELDAIIDEAENMEAFE